MFNLYYNLIIMENCCKDKKCCDNPIVTLTIVRISLGLFYLLFGLMKLFLMWPDAVTAMMTSLYWLEWVPALLLAWFVILTEIFWGIFILLWNKVPRILYKLALIWFIIIPVVWFLSTAIWTKDMLKTLFFHIQVTLVAIALLFSAPKCGFWITWDKE